MLNINTATAEQIDGIEMLARSDNLLRAG